MFVFCAMMASTKFDAGTHVRCRQMARRVKGVRRKLLIRPVWKQIEPTALLNQILDTEYFHLGDARTSKKAPSIVPTFVSSRGPVVLTRITLPPRRKSQSNG
jgi:hypothetical protein